MISESNSVQQSGTPGFRMRNGVDYKKLAEKHPLKVINMDIIAPSLKHKLEYAEDKNQIHRNQDSKLRYHGKKQK